MAAEEMMGRAEPGVGLGGKHKWPHESISGFTLSIPLRPHDTWVAVEKSARERSGDGTAHISGSNERPSVKKKKREKKSVTSESDSGCSRQVVVLGWGGVGGVDDDMASSAR